MRTFKVTQEDIEQGIQEDECRCPVALCLRRTLDLAPTEICVADAWVEVRGKKHIAPREVELFIDLFDRGEQVFPFSFELDDDNLA